jgi:uncharacterized protein (TIGR03086 family)
VSGAPGTGGSDVDTRHAVELLERALDRLRTVVAGVSPDQLGATVPSCPRWDVRGLLAHLLVDVEQFVPMTQGGTPDFAAAPPEVDGTGLAQLDERSAGLRAAWRAADDLSGAVGLQVPELTLHAWDLANATGQRLADDEELDATSLASMEAMLEPEYRGTADDPQMFGPERTAPAGASTLDRLVAFSGRQP